MVINPQLILFCLAQRITIDVGHLFFFFKSVNTIIHRIPLIHFICTFFLTSLLALRISCSVYFYSLPIKIKEEKSPVQSNGQENPCVISVATKTKKRKKKRQEP